MAEKRQQNSASEQGGVHQTSVAREGSTIIDVGHVRGDVTIGGRPHLPSTLSTPPETPSAAASTHAVDIFLSHVSAEKAVARVLASWITRTFQRRLVVFMDEQSIPVGDAWLARIEDALKTARMMLVVASPISLAAQWVNFEVGAAWAREMPIVFLCHAGISRDTLPFPYYGRQSLDLPAKQFPEQLLTAIASRFQTGDLPPLAYGQMAEELSGAMSGNPAKEAGL